MRWSLRFDPFDRMLLTADGTATSLLEACTGEPITTRTTRQAGPAKITGRTDDAIKVCGALVLPAQVDLVLAELDGQTTGEYQLHVTPRPGRPRRADAEGGGRPQYFQPAPGGLIRVGCIPRRAHYPAPRCRDV
jgi:hypothetical protein